MRIRLRLESVVTSPSSRQAREQLRMEQVGFRPGSAAAYGGARAGWQQFFENLERVLAGMN